MHDIEPYYGWRERYVAAEDEDSPFYNRVYSEFSFTNKVYNYFIHPQWDEFGSDTLYLKILYVDYSENYAVIEFIGEWNDAITNDIMLLKRNIIDRLMRQQISKFLLVLDNVLNFHGDDDSYYEEWYEDVMEEGGWVCAINLLDHVMKEMVTTGVHYFFHLGEQYNDVEWRRKDPALVYHHIQDIMHRSVKQLRY